jgi:hypothetical protein
MRASGPYHGFDRPRQGEGKVVADFWFQKLGRRLLFRNGNRKHLREDTSDNSMLLHDGQIASSKKILDGYWQQEFLLVCLENAAICGTAQ